VTIIRLNDLDVSKFFYVDIVKMVLMMFDTRFTMFDDYESRIASGENFVIDGRGMSFRHFLNVASNLKTVRLYMRFLQEVSPFIIKNMHFVNCSAVVDRMFSLVKPLLKKELIDVMHFHRSGLESLHKFIPKDILPQEYGGTLGAIGDIHKTFCGFVESKRFAETDIESVQCNKTNFVFYST
jgi:CRAL/TRIO domain